MNQTDTAQFADMALSSLIALEQQYRNALDYWAAQLERVPPSRQAAPRDNLARTKLMLRCISTQIEKSKGDHEAQIAAYRSLTY